MGFTPDSKAGPSLEEETQYEDRTADGDPTVDGAVRRIGDDLRFKTSGGVVSLLGGGGGGGTHHQEQVTTQAITGTDTALTDELDAVPVSSASVKLLLNGLHQQQGAGKDYTISGKVITWLQSSGSAVPMDTSDILEAIYVS